MAFPNRMNFPIHLIHLQMAFPNMNFPIWSIWSSLATVVLRSALKWYKIKDSMGFSAICTWRHTPHDA
jgi:hypothetical protein